MNVFCELAFSFVEFVLCLAVEFACRDFGMWSEINGMVDTVDRWWVLWEDSSEELGKMSKGEVTKRIFEVWCRLVGCLSEEM